MTRFAIYIVFILLVFELVRIPLFAIFNVRDFGSVLHALVIFSPLLLYRKFSLTFDRTRLFLIGGLWSFAVSIMLFSMGLSYSEYSSNLFSLFGPFLFLILIDVFSNDENDWETIVSSIMSSVFYIGCAYFILEWLVVSQFKIVSICDLASFYRGERDNQFCNTSRYMPFGFFIYKDMSLAILMGSFFSFRNWSNLVVVMSRFILILSMMLMVDSITLDAIFIIMTIIKFNRYLKGRIDLGIFSMLIILNLFLYGPSFQRIKDYILNELDLNSFLPVVESCGWRNLGITFHGLSEGCHSHEVHSLFYLFKYGFLATAPWYATLLYTLIFSVKSFFLRGTAANSFLFFPMVFIANSIHYSGAESWGVNFLFFLMLFISMNHERAASWKIVS